MRAAASRSIRTKLLLVVAIPAVSFVIAASGFFVYQAEERDASGAVARTLQVTAELESLLVGLVDAETGVSGYLLTDDTAWLEPYERAIRDVPATVETLGRLVREDEVQSARFEAVRPAIDRRLDQLASIRATAPSAGEMAPEIRAMLEEGRVVMDGLRAALAEVSNAEAARLVERRSSAEAVRTAGTVLGGVSLMVALGGGLLGVVLLGSTLVARTRRLEENARRLVRGEPGLPMPPSGDEIGRLAATLAEAEALLREREEAIRRSERFLDSVVENLPDMVFVKDAEDLRFVRLNRAGEALLGVSRDELLGKTDADLFPPEEAASFTATDRAVLAGTDIVDVGEEPIDTAHGRRILHTKKIPILDGDGRPIYLLGISEDITERKRIDEALDTARLDAERASQAKSEFLSRMSHELRTPLNAVLGFAQLMALDELTDEQRENLHYITRAGDHLLALINEVLDISRIEAGQMTISPEPVHVVELTSEVIALMGPLAADRSIAIDVDEAVCDLHVLADRQRLKQILLNLVSNAVKYNRVGGSVAIACRTEHEGRLALRVSDTGYGIAPEHRDRLFVPFERLGADVSQVEGTGMGLALSKGLIEAMGGTIGVESEIDVGTTFWVELDIVDGPIEAYERNRPARSDPGGSPSTAAVRRILHIEDNASNLRLVERILARRSDLDLVTAMQGGIGLDLARTDPPAVILLDLHLPDMPGRDVLRELRRDPATREIPVVVISADATKTQIERLTQDGASGYLTKPLDVGAFLDLLDVLLA